jgi:RNA polymerase sigma-54 factor
MKTSLHLGLSQQLSMTPQLQQAIRLLQLSSLDLNTEIQETVDANPLLEILEAEANEATQTYTSSVPSRSKHGSYEYSELEEQNAQSFNLQDHLLWQAQLSHFTEKDYNIAVTLIDAMNDDGYLGFPLEEIHAGLEREFDIDLEDLLSVLRRIQHFDPIGVGARDLKECLLIQLEQYPAETPFLSQAKQLVTHHLARLAKQEQNYLSKVLKLNFTELQAVISLVQSCHPRPGSTRNLERPEYIIPDAFVYKVNGHWQVALNEEYVPKLQINSSYAALIRRADSSADNQFLRTQLQEARWFLKSLQNRQETLLKVVRTIVRYQNDFLEQGEEAMRPLVLQTIAKEINMHESTVSRVSNKKYLHTPRGTYELKYFFSSHVHCESGNTCSATAIRASLKRLIAAEDLKKPLSDNQLCELLKEKGIIVARRTIAKYRESIHIPPSNERRRII